MVNRLTKLVQQIHWDAARGRHHDIRCTYIYIISIYKLNRDGLKASELEEEPRLQSQDMQWIAVHFEWSTPSHLRACGHDSAAIWDLDIAGPQRGLCFLVGCVAMQGSHGAV